MLPTETHSPNSQNTARGVNSATVVGNESSNSSISLHSLQSDQSLPDVQLDGSADEVAANEGEPSSAGRWLARLTAYFSQNRVSALLCSLIVHTGLFLLLALLTFRQLPGRGDQFDFVLGNGIEESSRNAPEVQILSTEASPAPPADQIDSNLDQATVAENSTDSVQLAQLLDTTANEPATTATASQKMDVMAAAAGLRSVAPFASTGVEGRDLAKRSEVALSRGGTLESEQAVERALEWLARHQRPNGSWSLVHDAGECNGRCANPGSQERFDPAATGLSLLAFLGAGYTHRDGKHRETVRRGIYYLIQIREEQSNRDSYVFQSERGMYNHGIAAFALCEAYQMTNDSDLKEPAARAAQFIVEAQSYQGGWGYLPKQPGDLTITGWQIMALKSSYASGFDVPSGTLGHLDLFLDSQTKDDIHYGYRNTETSTTCTAIGMLLRMFRGRSSTDPRILEGVRLLETTGASTADVYFNYYATLALYHVGGNVWREWHPRVREYLINTQATEGHEAGSWYFENPYGREGGRLYTTAMAAMTLEIYYRYAPLYQQVEVPFEL